MKGPWANESIVSGMVTRETAASAFFDVITEIQRFAMNGALRFEDGLI